MIKGSVSKIETLGLVDGPGIRTVVFLSGCKLRCKYCHNPEMWKKTTPNYTSSELAERIIKNKPYFKRNNGGITFSGGEPLLQSEFLIEVCKLLKKENIHIALDTSGVGNGNYKELLSYIDLILLDIKHTDKNEYRELTGYDIKESDNFIKELNKSNKPVIIRQVILPGLTDNIDYIKTLKQKIKTIKNIQKVEFLPYHTLGITKYQELDLNYPLSNVKPMDKEKCEKLYQEFIKLK